MRRQTCQIIITLLILAVSAPAVAGTPRILLVGDSWSWFLWLNRSFKLALEEAGLGEWEECGLYTTIPGSTVREWTQPEWLEKVREELERHPTIDIVHLSTGGNDFLENWHPKMKPADQDKLFQQVVRDEEKLIRFILSVRPNIRVAVCNYDYINRAKRGATVQETNKTGMVLAKMKLEMIKTLPRTQFIQNYGVMQHYYGIDEIPPGTLPLPGNAPDYEPFPGGDPSRGAPKVVMFDNVHLNQEGYNTLARHCLNVVYKDWLENPLSPVPVEETTTASAKK